MMKNFAAIALFLFASAHAIAQANIEFESNTLNYSEIEYGSDGARTFTFKNTGNKPLMIKEVISTRGVTILEKPKEAIAAGKKGKIKIVLDTKKSGPVRKTITVFANTKDSPYPIKVKGMVKEK